MLVVADTALVCATCIEYDIIVCVWNTKEVVCMTTTITARVDSDKKRQAEEIFNDIGMTLSGAINVFINEVVILNSAVGC